MADEQNLSKRAGLTKGKMALIGVLAAVLAGVLYIQYAPESAASGPTEGSELDLSLPVGGQPTPAGPGESLAAALASASEPVGGIADTVDHANWKTPEIASVIAHDPFAVPASFPRTVQVAGDPQGLLHGTEEGEDRGASQLADAVTQVRSELEELRQRGVRVIVKQRDQYVAMIGDRTIQVGDDINGFTVTAIGPDGVRVERKVQQ